MGFCGKVGAELEHPNVKRRPIGGLNASEVLVDGKESHQGSVIDPRSQTAYVLEEAGTQRYSVGTDTPKLLATSCGGVPLANSFLAA